MKNKLYPLQNIKIIDKNKGVWRSINEDPQFLISNCYLLAGASVKISVKIKCVSELDPDPVIYIDYGNGLSEKNTIRFKMSIGGDFRADADLPKTLHKLRFDPISFQDTFTISEFKIEAVQHNISYLQRLLLGFKMKYSSNMISGAKVDHNQEEKNYQKWIKDYDFKPEMYEEARQLINEFSSKTRISILMPTYNTPRSFLIKAIESVRTQVYPYWELCIADDCSTDSQVREVLSGYADCDNRIKVKFQDKNGHISAASNAALELATGEYIGLLDHDDELHPMALFCVAQAIQNNPEVNLLYTDEDKLTEEGLRLDPYFKTDFNYDLFMSQNMICHFGVYKTEILRGIGGFRLGFEGSQDYDIALRFLEKINYKGVVHIPYVLYHWRIHGNSTASNHEAKSYAQVAAIRAVQEHLQRQLIKGVVETAPGAPAYNCVRYEVPKPLPSVELIIPTRDRAELLGTCVRSILGKTSYENYNVTIIDNGSVLPETHKLFSELTEDSRVRVMKDESPFNYSAINNRIALKSKSQIIGLVNNDIEVINEEWLHEMVSLAIQPKVGCVGAKLLYSDNTLQHAGVILGIGGVAGHSHKKLRNGNPGYFSRTVLRSTMSAVTAACMIIRSDIYREVGGLDESFSVAFNDVDFCLRVREAGYRNVWTPYAELFHHESATRGHEDTPEKKARFSDEIKRMQGRWGEKLEQDPFYSPNLTLVHEDFSYAWPPRVKNLFDKTL